MSMNYSKYDREAVKPMWQELEAVGIKPLTSGDEVEKYFEDKKGTALIVVNSVCGCAAGSARPGVALALQNKKIPDRLATVFAGVDMEAVKTARGKFGEIPPTSPSVYLFKDGEVAFVLPRNQIEGFTAEQIAGKLAGAFEQHCQKKGPSVDAATLQKVFRFNQIPTITPDK